jgi:predicted metal-dependent enzyme (double-stranded beta helix superfamily)
MDLSRRRVLAATVAAAVAGPTAFGATNDEVEELVSRIRDAYADGQPGVEEMLRQLASQPARLVAALGEPTKGGIRSLYNDSDITILNIVWAPLMVLRPHDHNMWASIGVYGGREDNVYWQRKGNTVEAIGAKSLGRGDVGSLGADGVHSVINPVQKLTAAIHVYGGDFFAPGRSQWMGEDLEKAPFSQTGLVKHFMESNERFKL